MKQKQMKWLPPRPGQPAPQPPKEWETEQHFFELPTSLEYLLPAISALQDYYKWLAKRKVRADLTVLCPASIDLFAPAIVSNTDGCTLKVVHSAEGLYLNDFDEAVKLDPEIAYGLSEKTQKHVAQVFGMMVGSDPPKVLPDLKKVVQDAPATKDICVLPFPGCLQVVEFLQNSKPELEVDSGVVANLTSEQAAVSMLSYRMIVGARSGLTYLAAALGRAVVEIYPTDKHRNWLSKWGNPRYQMIYGNPGEVTPELVYRAVEAIWKRVEQWQRATQVVENVV